MKPYRIREIGFTDCRDFMIEHHYAKGMANTCIQAYGLFEGKHLIGAAAFNSGCSEAARSDVFGPDYKSTVAELHRLTILDVTPKNTETWFLARCFRQLHQDQHHLLACKTFSDPTFGHVGTIYQASNARYYGQSKPETFYLDQTGRLRHRRQCGKNISLDEAVERGWTPKKVDGKYRYLFFLSASPAERRELRKCCLLPSMEFPKIDLSANGAGRAA